MEIETQNFRCSYCSLIFKINDIAIFTGKFINFFLETKCIYHVIFAYEIVKKSLKLAAGKYPVEQGKHREV